MASSFPRTRNLYDPLSDKPFKLSRSRIERFLQCPRCFYLDRRLGIDQPDSYPLTLNIAVDYLLKKEFDAYRAKQEPHPIMKKNTVDAIPFQHKDLNTWRENFEGVQFHHKETNLIITGAVDDVWINSSKQLIVVDYKATSTAQEINMQDEWRRAYGRQMAIYQWLLRQNKFSVSETGYFLYMNGQKDREGFYEKLEFTAQLIPYVADDSWVEQTVFNAYECLQRESMPDPTPGCSYCSYRAAALKIETKPFQKTLF